MSRGKFKYVCEDCNEETWLDCKDRNSRFRPRCISCGSLSLIPSKKSTAKKKIADFDVAKIDFTNMVNKKMNKH
jgi:hypothetical protein